jgi:hypothetical protein
MFFPLSETSTDDLSRRSFGLDELQTGHLQPISGMPVDVPVPKNFILNLQFPFSSEFFSI